MAAPSKSGWQAAILKGIGAPVTAQNLRFFDAWVRAEGGSASNNPFNTTQPAPGASAYNSNGGFPVKNYVSPEQGIDATIETLKNGHYPNILSALRAGNDAGAAAAALADSPWGTGSLVQKILGSGGGQVRQTASAAKPTAAPAPEAPVSSPAPQQPSGLDLRTALLGNLIAQNNAFASGGEYQGPSLGSILAAIQPSQPSPQEAPGGPGKATPIPAPEKLAKAVTGGEVKPLEGIAEAFYDPLGSYDNGKFGGPIGGHSDHDHFSFSTPDAALNAIKLAESLGMSVRENPYVDPVDPNVHVAGSFHYKTFPGTFNGKKLGQAIDASGTAAQMAKLYRLITGGG